MTAPAINITPLVEALAAAMTTAGVPFGDSNKPPNVGKKPYVVGYFDGGQVTDRSLRTRDGLSLGAVFHSYGLSPASVRGGRKALLAAVFGLAGQNIDGWTVHKPVHQVPVPMDRDDAVDPPLYWQTDEITLRLTRA